MTVMTDRLPAAFNTVMSQLISGYTQLETSLGSIARLRDFERDVVPEAKEGEDLEPPPSWPDRGQIEFRHVTVSHKLVNPVPIPTVSSS